MKLPPEEQKAILGEHGQIGFSFGAGDLAHDIRLACHGLDANDNDFVIGLTGKELFPLSALVQTMRKTRQTSEFLTQLGPFFVGKAVYKSPHGVA
jgi:chlorite dismutase